jgi:H+/Cl- antiporter ClcA
VDRAAQHRRRLRVGWLSRRIWRRRLVFWFGALAVGVLSVFFAWAANWSQAVFAHAASQMRWLPLIATPAGFVLCVWLARTFFPGSAGSGIPNAIAARSLRTGIDREQLLAPKLIVGKIGLTVLGLLCGASVGREGPTVQIGAALMLLSGRLGKLQQQRGLILAGSAAGISAAFNTPIAGIVFAIEEMSRSFEQRTSGLVFYAVIIAGLASLALVGNYTYFGTSTGTVATAADWLLVAVSGALGGLMGGLFSRLLLDGTRYAARWVQGDPLRRSLALALACGIIVAATGILTGGATFGTGYDQARSAVEGHPLAWYFWPAKLVATLATSLSGIPGGLFAPSLTVGAGLGSWLAHLGGSQIVSVAAVLGMAGYFAGVVQAPLTAFVIILEMTGSNANLLPIMIAAAIGFGAAKLVAPEALYHGLAESIIADARAKQERQATTTAAQAAR